MKVWVWIAVIFMTSSAFSKTHLNGVAGYEHLNKEYYLAALYLPEANADPVSILSDNRAQRMVIKVTVSRWSVRKFTAFWKEGFALNNNLSADAVLTEQIAQFIRLPKEALVSGDVIEVQHVPMFGTEVHVNGKLVLNVEGKSLFNAVVKTWIGSVPHSRLFQSQILGQDVDMGSSLASRIARFKTLETTAERKALVAKWQAAEKAEQLAVAQAEAALRQEQEQAAEAKRKAAAEKKKREAEQKAARLAAAKAKKEAEAAKAREQDQAKIEQAVSAQREAERKAAALEQAINAEKSTEQNQQKAISYAEELYRWEVMRDVYKRVSYPEWARQFNQEGTVSIEFIVGNQGQLLGITKVSPEDSGLLGQELKDAVKRAAPYAGFPVIIKQNQMKITLAYNFTLSERVAELPPAPIAPEGVGEAAQLSNVQKAVTWSNYQKQIVDQVIGRIEYPFWARDLKQQGKVSAELVIRSDGSVDSVRLVEKTRHAILNQEIEQAVGRIGTFEAFPSWVKDQTLKLLIEHTFELN